MKIVEMKIDFVRVSGEIIGRAKYESSSGRGNVTLREIPSMVYGRELPSGSFQLYQIDNGSISKIGVMKSQNMDWTETLRK